MRMKFDDSNIIKDTRTSSDSGNNSSSNKGKN